MRRMMAGILLISLTALAFAGAVFWSLSEQHFDLDSKLAAAREAFDNQHFSAAMRLSDQVLNDEPLNLDALIVGGAAAAGEKQFDRAWSYYSRIQEINSPQTANAMCVAAHLMAFERYHLQDAEWLNRKVLSFDPQHVAANSGIANLLGLTGQRWEAIPHTLILIRQGKCSTNQLILIGSETGVHEDEKLLRACIEASPDDSRAALGLGWNAYRTGRMDEAQRWAEFAVAHDPRLISAQALLGSLLVASAAESEKFTAWHAQLPVTANDHPEIWLVRGQQAQRLGQPAAAIRCYWETLRRNPNYRIALYQLSQLLIQRDESDLAGAFLERAAQLQRLKEAEAALFEGIQDSLDPIQRVAEQMEALGRYWEAWGWSQFAQQIAPRVEWPVALSRRTQAHLTPDSPLTIERANPAYQIDLSSYPEPSWKDESRHPVPREESCLAESGSMMFEDDAKSAGIDFTYFNSADTQIPGQLMFEFSGGGVGCIDYDLDGWPDLFLSQGCRWPVNHSNFEFLDALYRNNGGEQFSDVALQSGIHENDFSQGLAVGDYNNDGFPDLFIGNIGQNRLYQNQGDGTFSEVTSHLPSVEGLWTTSCAIADLNGDSWPDLYAINYVEGPDVFQRMCHHKDGVARMCAPFDFPGSPAQLFLSQGDGSFVDASSTSGLAAPNGKGLGLLIADFDQSGKLEVFVANDLVPNFYYANRAVERGDPPQFEEIGMACGLALNSDGQAQGCMGIAADDLNGDGRLDLYVTNFYMESNTLYQQIDNEVFADRTSAAGLVQPSLPMLGFGVQTVDADLDGVRDLVVTNGHVDDHRAYGQPYAMRPQAFQGIKNGRFHEVATAGTFFQQERLGRGMCRLDWNRDGREDIAISHLESPAALLTNRSPHVGHALVLHLRGIDSDRDAVGSIVTVQTKHGIQTRQITAGDGYQGSNQRTLHFGLADEVSAGTVTVRWPGGLRQTFLHVDADREWLCLEGHSDLVVLSVEADQRERNDVTANRPRTDALCQQQTKSTHSFAALATNAPPFVGVNLYRNGSNRESPQ